jgi:tRNA threonylcarbamoyladenosine biosynthesis protein TsaE
MGSRTATLDLYSHSGDCTRRLGFRLGRRLRGGELLFLSGGLGAGKTTFAQGLAAALHIEGPITSPTFTLVNEYTGRSEIDRPVELFHLDLYRLASGGIETIGLDDYLDRPAGITVIEWPEVAAETLPTTALLVEFTLLSETKRRLSLTPLGPADSVYPTMIDSLRQELFGDGAH